ncbi:MAG: MBL fold metallo-hydrolase [Beijerinckiaceae bacterium]|jgi:metallo-beta-lactamase family protein|nr:MBL fold metallo-hydrolase [Beijerinckiaceae bacterium]
MAAISFYGAAGTVTGSCSLVQTDNASILVDCGMFQGNRTVRQLNFDPFPFDPAKVDHVILTHAHIDHSGLLPKLVKHGFKGKVHATPATCDLVDFMLMDSASIQESDVERVNRKQRRRGKDELQPLYTREDARELLSRMRPVDYETWFTLDGGVRVRFWNAGHILGSASAEVQFDDKASGNSMRMLFSGDLGPDEKVFHPEPDAPEGFDYIVCESTYGNRDREDYTLEKRREALRTELVEGLRRGGNIVIPSFAVERSQELLHDIGVLLARKEIPDATVFLDSPLARKVTEVFAKYSATLDDIAIDDEQLFRDPHFRFVESVEESKAINRIKGGAIIISASGMCDAGRIKHHLKNNIWDKRATILFVGYQAPGTLGHVITSGSKDVRIHGVEFKVHANIRSIGNYSAHADQGELLAWIEERAPIAGGLFLNHGEQEAREELRRLSAERGIDIDKILLPMFDETFALSATNATSEGRPVQRIDDTALERDWHNDYASFILELANKLEATEDAAARRKMIGRLHDAINP